MPRPSGLSIIDDDSASIIAAVAKVDIRGRLNILPRWRKKVPWLVPTGEPDLQALMIFAEPGLISIIDWKVQGPRIQQRISDLSNSTDAEAIEALRLIKDRYQRLIIPVRDRTSLGDAALAHLGMRVERGQKSIIYVYVYSDRIELMSPACRDTKLLEGHPLIEDLP